MKPLSSALIAWFVVTSSLAFAQNAAGKLEDKKGANYNEIERGFFFEARGGFNGVINPPARSGSASYFSTGQAIGIDVGFDIGERVSPAIFFLASSNRMGSDYTGLSTTGAALRSPPFHAREMSFGGCRLPLETASRAPMPSRSMSF
jgi:hypothetical protein